MREKMRQLLPLARKKLLWICSGILGILLYLMLVPSSTGYPVQEATAAEQAAAAGSTEKPRYQKIRGAEAAAGRTELHDPFSAAHERRTENGQLENHVQRKSTAQPDHGKGTVLQSQPAETRTVPEPVPAVLPVLKGVLCSNTRKAAVLAWKGQEFSLAEGEARDGIELLTIQADAVCIRDAAGEHVLSLQK